MSRAALLAPGLRRGARRGDGVDRPDILIVEGSTCSSRPACRATAWRFPSSRFLRFFGLSRRRRERSAALVCQPLPAAAPHRLRDPKSYFRKYAELAEAEAIAVADRLWSRINLANLRDNILPTRQRASLILRKGASHRIEQVALRRL
jgi:type I pantothenate kinase